jgi:hypothetical protein
MMNEIEKQLLVILRSKYHPALEIAVAERMKREFAGEGSAVVERSKRFRQAIEQIEQVSSEMASIVAGAVQ